MPKLFVIETPTEEVHVTAMDFRDALETWGGKMADLLAVKEYENPKLGVDTLQQRCYSININ